MKMNLERYITVLVSMLGICFQTTAQNLNLQCSDGWDNLYGRCYLIVPVKHTWGRARDFCNIYGAVLAEPSGNDLTNALSEHARLKNLDEFWIGYNRINSDNSPEYEGTWSDGRLTGVEVGVWAPFQPDTTSGKCTFVGNPWNAEDVQRQWYMTSCNHVKSFVCERSPCPSDTFTCTNGRCVGETAICNSANDCGDNSDEQHCPSYCSEKLNGDNGKFEVTPTTYYKPNRDCLFTIEVDVGKRIQIHFDTFDTEENLDILEIWDGGPTIMNSQLITRISGQNPGQYGSYISSTHHLTLRFLTDNSVQKQGFTFTWDTNFSCEILQQTGFDVRPDTAGYEKRLTPRQNVDDCVSECNKSSQCWGFQYDITEVTNPKCFIITEAPILMESTCCNVYLKTCPLTSRITSVGNIPTPNSNLVASSTPGDIFTPMYPFRYIGNYEHTFIITVTGNKLITLQILTVDLCCTDNIAIYDGVGPESPLLMLLEKGSQPSYVTSTGNNIYLHMTLLQHWTCKGVLIKYFEGCEVAISTDSGQIRSPGYDVNNYPDIKTCSWSINPPSEKSVRLFFTDFQTEEDKDFVKIYKGLNAQGEPIHKEEGYSGTQLPDTLTSTNGFFITFETSGFNNDRGFHARFSAGCPKFDTVSFVLDPASDSFHAPDTVVVRCAEGYLFGGGFRGEASVTLTCRGDGTWNLNNLPFCERQYCGLAQDLSNGYIVTASGVQGGDVIQYECADGFTIEGSKLVTCLSNSSWGILPKCTATECPALDKVLTNAKFINIKGDGIQHASVVKVTCDQYYELIGPETITCNQGQWQSELPNCQPMPCSLTTFWNAKVNMSQSFVMNAVINVTCNPGYTVSGGLETKGSFRCGVDNQLHCQNIDECNTGLSECVNAECQDTDGSYICTCLPGFIPSEDSLTACEDVDECAGGLNICDHICSNTPGSYNCSCNDGYDLYTSAGFNGYILGNGEDGSKPWHIYHIGHTCVLKKCESDTILKIADGEALTSATSFYYGDKVEILCDIGLFASGTSSPNMTTTCGIDGQWSQRPVCDEVAFCNETNLSAVTPTGRIRFEEKYSLTCTRRNGQQVVLQRLCGYDKDTRTYKTYGDLLACPETDCGEAPVYTGVKPFVTPSTLYNSTIVFECEGQYVRKGSSPLGVFGNSLVRCNENGVWDFGTLRCEGGQCPDPGYPVNGYTTLSSWSHGDVRVYSVAIGTVATFSCNIPGYEPMPSATATCIKVGETSTAWDNPVPTCVDTMPPKFADCPEDSYVDAYTSVFYAEPTATDNTAVKTLGRFPENFRPGMVMDSTSTLTYIATDFSDNQQWCQFRIIINDKTPPKLFCNTPTIITANQGDTQVNTELFTSVDDPTATLFAAPAFVTANYNTIGTNPILSYTATDPSKNVATCLSQIKIAAPTCEPDILVVNNGEIACDRTPQSGYTCTISCNSGYYFYENASLSTISVSCDFGGEWNREMPVCTAPDLAHFRVSIMFQYQRLTYVDDSCGILYEKQIRDQLLILTNSFTALCDNVSSTAFDVSPSPSNSVDAGMDGITGVLKARLAVDLEPGGLIDDEYFTCAQRIYQAFYDVSSSVTSISALPGSIDSCPQVQMDRRRASVVGAYAVCSSNAKATKLDTTKHICLACPPGTYGTNSSCAPCGAGFYSDAFYSSSCTPCPSETNSKKEGAMRIKDCYEDCGKYLYSSNGKAPCTDCPPDTFWVNSTYCEPCPDRHHTKGRGARSSQECIAQCKPGQFSSDGLEPCTLCPKHFYQAASRATSCTECNSNLITLKSGSNSSVDCLDGFATHCGTNPCLNSNMCMVVRHEYSCNCSAGYTGRNCETQVTPCDVGPCLNGGQCTPLNLTDYNCTCPAPFTGKNCEIDIDHCTDTSCVNNGTCIDQKGSFLCACASHSGYFGSSCKFPQDPCLRFPCNNSGICLPQGSYNRVCNCPDGFSGINCEYNLDECDPNPCANGAACIDGDNIFTCVCINGFKGTYCEQRNLAGICSLETCSAGRGCVDNYITNSRYCLCNEGWYFDDEFKVCRVNTKYCENYDCGTDGQCISYDGGYHLTCHCNIGYGGTRCQLNIDDCTYHPCKNNATCSDGVNDFSCTCTKAGSGGKTCDDNLDGCSSCLSANTDSCTDRLDGHICYCKDGFRGTNCEVEIPTCDGSPCKHGGTCDNPVAPGLTECTCSDYWIGEFCETIKNNCLTGQECENGGQCISTSTGYVCNCVHGYTGAHCEERYDLCEISKPCVGEGNTCEDNAGGIKCNCDRAYTGDSCETLLWYCSDDTCENNGTCTITDNGVKCTCVPGFTGYNCNTNIDECQTITCPQNSICRDGINSAQCVCLDDKVGENCQKDSSDDFDYIVLPPAGCIEEKSHVSYSFTTSAFTLAFWIRLTVLNEPDAIVTLFGVQKSGDSVNDWVYRVRVNGKGVRFDMSRGQSTIELPLESNDIEDGLWHHVAVSWSNENGYLTLYLNGEYLTEDFFAIGQSLTDWGYLLLGSVSSSAMSFTGRISKLKLFNEKLGDEAITKLFQRTTLSDAASIIPQGSLKTLHSVDYNSQLFRQICTSHTSCPDRAFQASAYPQVQSCPRDFHVVNTSRISRPWWDDSSTIFLQTMSDTRTKTSNPGETDIDWGVHGIGIAEYSADRHAAVCLFRIFKSRKDCYDPSVPADLSHDCEDGTHGEGRSCKISCKQAGYSVSQETPKYYTCSKYGMWDGTDKTGVFFYPSCSPVWDGTNNLMVQVQYTITNCQTQRESLLLNLTSRVVQMNSDWGLGLCKTDQGGNDERCNSIEISVDCTTNSEASVNIMFPNTPETVSDGTDTIPTEGAFKISAIDQKMLVFEPAALPVMSSYIIESTMTCPPGSHLLGTECVKCGSGTYYDNTSSKCVRCPKGTYRTVRASTPILSACTSCSGSDTTTNTGSPEEGYCHVSCFYGKFYNWSSRSCESCPVGLYNDVIGSSYCKQCNITDTTRFADSVESSSCISFALLTTTTTVTASPAVGESRQGGGLSAGVITAIVISVVIVLLIIVICVFLCLTKRLPCFAKEKKIVPTGPPHKHVYKYGETNMKYLNYRLSDLRENKEKTMDKMPIYTEPRTPDDSVSIRDDISIQVPIFMEKLNGTVHKKHTYISNGRSSEIGSELDRTIERPVSERAFSGISESERFTVKENDRSVADSAVAAPVTPTPPRARRKHGGSRRGRPPAQLMQYESPQIRPRALAPLHNRQLAPEIQMTSEYIRPLPSFSRQRSDVTPYQYEDFLETGTPTTSQFGSDKILLDSDDEDLR